MRKKGKKEISPPLLQKIAERPLLVLVSFIITLLGLIISIILPLVLQAEMELVYAVNPVKTEVVSMGKATGLEVRYNGAELGDVDITATQVAIWNSGDESIRKENILKEVVIYTDPPVRILEAYIVKVHRELEVTNLNILKSDKLMDNGKICVSWDILEKNDGASIQLIYLGSSDVEIGVNGLIEGCGEIKRVGREIEIKSPAEQFEAAKPAWWALIMLTVLALGLTYFFVPMAYSEWKGKDKGYIITICMLLAQWGVMAYFYWNYFGVGPLEPPFGF